MKNLLLDLRCQQTNITKAGLRFKPSSTTPVSKKKRRYFEKDAIKNVQNQYYWNGDGDPTRNSDEHGYETTTYETVSEQIAEKLEPQMKQRKKTLPN